MSNAIGYCDNFISNGLSSIWNRKGELIGQLNKTHQGLLTYDTETDIVEVNQLSIEKGNLSDLDDLFQIYKNAKIELEKNGIHQWTEVYPTRSIIEDDLRKNFLFVLRNGKEIIGAINLNEEQEDEYQTINWKFDNSNILVIHRLVVEPKYQGKGYARILMNFAENFAKENGYTSIRLDAYSKNERVIKFYQKRKYFIRGNVHFTGRDYPFHCMEKEIKTGYKKG